MLAIFNMVTTVLCPSIFIFIFFIDYYFADSTCQKNLHFDQTCSQQSYLSKLLANKIIIAVSKNCEIELNYLKVVETVSLYLFYETAGNLS